MEKGTEDAIVNDKLDYMIQNEIKPEIVDKNSEIMINPYLFPTDKESDSDSEGEI